jgi:hypothetical protein
MRSVHQGWPHDLDVTRPQLGEDLVRIVFFASLKELLQVALSVACKDILVRVCVVEVDVAV